MLGERRSLAKIYILRVKVSDAPVNALPHLIDIVSLRQLEDSNFEFLSTSLQM